MIRIKAPVVLALLLSASVIVTFVFWRQVSFGRRLGDAELVACLAPEATARNVQHAIEEITQRAREGQPGMDRWHEKLVAASTRPEATVRRTAAWGMQLTPDAAALAPRLRELVATDPDATVRRNAALALSGARDPSAARPVLRSMLEPFVVAAPAAGTVESLSDLNRRPSEDAMVGRMRGVDGARIEVTTPVPGRVLEHRAKEGDDVPAGAPLLVLAPAEPHVLAAAKALAAAGTREDVEFLRRFLTPGGDVTPAMADQCRRAIAAIEARDPGPPR